MSSKAQRSWSNQDENGSEDGITLRLNKLAREMMN